jgi:serine/threonine-protein phosphatase 2A regulatory subunit B
VGVNIDKTIKLWKVHEKQLKVVSEFNTSNTSGGGVPFHKDRLKLPKMSAREAIVTATPRRIFANAHAYHINAISVNSDGETFLSADDLRVNIWSLDHHDQSFSKYFVT